MKNQLFVYLYCLSILFNLVIEAKMSSGDSSEDFVDQQQDGQPDTPQPVDHSQTATPPPLPKPTYTPDDSSEETQIVTKSSLFWGFLNYVWEKFVPKKPICWLGIAGVFIGVLCVRNHSSLLGSIGFAPCGHTFKSSDSIDALKE